MDEVKVIYEYLKDTAIKQPIMFDVGAHSGGAFYPFARDQWQVFAFEPNPVMREKINTNLKNWKFDKVEVFDFALSDTAGSKISFYVSPESTGISSLIPFHSSHEKKYEVDVSTVKDVAVKNGIQYINFLKIDVEGNDFKVLQGVDWQLNSPDVILVEYEDKKTKSLNITMPDILTFLQNMGYTVLVSEWYPVEKYGVSHKWKRYLSQKEHINYDPEGWGNLLAFKNFDDSKFITAVQRHGIQSTDKYQKENVQIKKQLDSIKNTRAYKTYRYLKSLIN